MNTKTKIICLLLVSTALHAGAGVSNPRAMAMAGAFGGIGLGAEAVLANPANLSLANANRLTISLLQMGAFAANNSFNKAHYNRYNGAFLDSSAKVDILNAIPGKGLQVLGRTDLQPLAVSYGPFAFSILFQAGANSRMDKQVAELLLLGNELNRIYSLQPFSGRGMAATSYIVSYGYAVPFSSAKVQHLGVGINLKYVRGHYYSVVDKMDMTTVTSFISTTAQGAAKLRTAEGGNGFGADLGVTTTFFERWRAFLVLENLLGHMRWQRNPEEITADFVLTENTVERIFDQDLEFDDVVLSNDTTLAIGAFSSRMPMVFRLGLVRGFKNVFIAAEFEKCTTASAWMSEKPLYRMGVEYQPTAVVRLRSGLHLGGDLPATWACGLGFQFGALRWDIGWQSVAGLGPNHLKGMGLATGFYFRY